MKREDNVLTFADEFGERHVKLPNRAFEDVKSGLITKAAVVVLMAVKKHLKQGGDYAFPSRETIAEATGIATESYIGEATSCLAMAGYMTKEQRKSSGFWSSCLYRIHIPRQIPEEGRVGIDEMEGLEKDFTMIPFVFIDAMKGFNTSTIILAFYLFSCLNRKGNNSSMTVWPKYDDICGDTGLGRAVVSKGLEELEDSGWIKTMGLNSRRNQYRLVNPHKNCPQESGKISEKHTNE